MRSYPHDSPEAAARIVALTMLADGHLSQAELDVLDREGGCATLGLERERLHGVLRALCEDLLQGHQAAWSDACTLEPHALCRLMAEVDDPALRRRVLSLCQKVVEADGHVSEGESLLLTQAIEQWGLHACMLEPLVAPALGARRLAG